MSLRDLSVLLVACVLCTAALCWAQPGGEESEKRIALVIGNAAYESGPLRNPVNDARAVTVTLRELGFEVVALENATQAAMKQAIDDFGESLHRAGKNTVGLFYYSGHGMQVKGRNYLIPLAATIRSERQVEYESVDAARVLGAMLDGGYAGKTPGDITGIQPRRYAVEMRLPGYQVWREEVVLRGGQRLGLSELLNPYTLAMLDTRSVEDTAEIYIDGALRGKGGTIIEDIEPGEHQIEARRARSRAWRQTMRPQAGEMESLLLAVADPHNAAVFPGRFTGQYVNNLAPRYGKRTHPEWALLGVHDALTQEPSFRLTFTRYDGFSIPRQTIAEIQKHTWRGLISFEVNTAYLRQKARAMNLDAVVLLAFSDPGETGPIDVYVYDPEIDRLHHAHSTWRPGNTTGQVAKATREALSAFI